MFCREIMKKIEERYPKRYAMEWDNVGLQVGRSDKEVSRIYIALDATDEVIEEAASWGADMLITHHPMIFKAMKQINDTHFIGRRILKLVRNDISYYAMHTNYDVMGMADLAGEILDMKAPQVLDVTCVEPGPCRQTAGECRDGKEQKENAGNTGDDEALACHEEGIGRVADLDEAMSLRACCEFVKEKFGLPNVKVFGDPDQKVRRIAISPGSGKSVIGAALRKSADLLITGDIDHHEGIDAVAQGMAVMDAGHYGIEHIFIADMKRFCEENFEHVEVRTADIRHPFWIA
ncbi:Nif3-like dinuclear metal center hexameric protein [Roseburia hominis]